MSVFAIYQVIYFSIFIRMALVFKSSSYRFPAKILYSYRISLKQVSYTVSNFLLFYRFHIVFFHPVAMRANRGHSLFIFEAYRSHTTTQRSQYDSPGRLIG